MPLDLDAITADQDAMTLEHQVETVVKWREQKVWGSSTDLETRMREQKDDYRREIEAMDYEQLLVELNRHVAGSLWRTEMCIRLARGKGWHKGPPTCWERIMGEDWC